ncbi:hypothetical protein BOX15_Mlig026604g1 [Macrostomum lignano]|uniref:thioredoxin-dependent peroxiredoxin n=2 Tax=Macrostomum lignano TaxID=282301 RepID=A0A1I8GKY6_9PLAT|nr:hypothetical protein BOX15_Mlig026604g1 [Macrostomum lignano]
MPGQEAVCIGDCVPDLAGTAILGDDVGDLNLQAYKSTNHYLVVIFVPSTKRSPRKPSCFAELAQMGEEMVKELHEKFKTYVVGVVDATPEQVGAWMAEEGVEGKSRCLSYPVICDPCGEFSSVFGMWQRGSSGGGLFRGHVIVNETGRLRHVTINHPEISRNQHELFRLVAAFKHTDVHGEVCPAEWKPGDATIIPDAVGSQEFFRKKWGT